MGKDNTMISTAKTLFVAAILSLASAVSDAEFSILIPTFGSTITLDVNANDTIQSVKEKLLDDPRRARLFFPRTSRTERGDDETLAKCGIKKDSIVLMVVRQCPDEKLDAEIAAENMRRLTGKPDQPTTERVQCH